MGILVQNENVGAYLVKCYIAWHISYDFILN